VPTYTYKARTPEGELVKGKIQSSGESLVLMSLEKQGVYPVEVKEAGSISRFMGLFKRRKKIGNEDKILFTRQLEAMLRSGVSLTSSIHALSQQADGDVLSQILVTVKKDIEGGSTFTQALKKHPNLYSDLYVSLIDAGEQAGMIDEMLGRIGSLIEYDVETRSRIKSATFYPSLVVGELLLAFGVIIKFVFPRFKSLFASRGADLPLPTQIMIRISDFAEHYWIHTLIGIALLYGFFRWYRMTPKGKAQFDTLVLQVPIFGDLILKVLMSRFARIFGALIESGLPILRSLTIVERTIQNTVVRQEIIDMGESIQKGKTIASSVRSGGIFPPAVIRMLEVGEEAGALDQMLYKISTFYDRQVDYRIKNLTTVIEPILLVVLGVSVLFTALAVFLPMWNIMHVVSGG
jgi:type IV pilus assembly protein PilC